MESGAPPGGWCHCPRLRQAAHEAERHRISGELGRDHQEQQRGICNAQPSCMAPTTRRGLAKFAAIQHPRPEPPRRTASPVCLETLQGCVLAAPLRGHLSSCAKARHSHGPSLGVARGDRADLARARNISSGRNQTIALGQTAPMPRMCMRRLGGHCTSGGAHSPSQRNAGLRVAISSARFAVPLLTFL